MKRSLSLLLSLIISVGSFSISAKDKHYGNDNYSKRGYERYENNGHKDRNNKDFSKDMRNFEKHKHSDYRKPDRRPDGKPNGRPDIRPNGRPNIGHYGQPNFRPERRHDKYSHRRHNFYRHYHNDRIRDFWNMVYYATGGGRNINVWQIADDCYVIRYFRNGRMYIRTLNPYTSVYGTPSLINDSWNPNPLWMLLPRVNISIDL